MPEEYLIKRYKNRKLYCTNRSCYITLIDLMDWYNKDIKFTIVENESKRDITKSTIIKAIFEYMDESFADKVFELAKGLKFNTQNTAIARLFSGMIKASDEIKEEVLEPQEIKIEEMPLPVGSRDTIIATLPFGKI